MWKYHIYMCVNLFSVLVIWYWRWSVIEFGSWGLAQYNLLRDKLLVLNTRAIFYWLLFFCWNWKNGLTAHSWIATTIDNHSHPPKSINSFHVGKITKSRKEAKRDRTNIRMGDSITVKVGDIDAKIREGEIRRTRKDMVSLHCLLHIASALLLSHFWWLVLVFSMVYRCWTPIKGLLVKYHTCIDNFVPLTRLSTL